MQRVPRAKFAIQPISESMMGSVLQLNNDNTPHVNALTQPQLEALVDMADGAWSVVGEADHLVGFALVMGPGKPYESLNYRWFERQFDAFHYLDRIVVSPTHRRHGVGTKLYELVFAEALRARMVRVCCEVNLSPPNPGSIVFHEGLGFQGVGEQATEAGLKQVLLMARSLESGEAR